MKSIIDLAESSKIIQESLGSKGVCETLARLLEIHNDNVHISEHLLWAISRLCRREQDQYATACLPNITRFGAVGVCQQVVWALKRKMAHASIVAASFRTIVNLASSTQSNKSLLRDAGCCESIVQALLIHIQDPLIADQACWVITFLACDHPENKVGVSFPASPWYYFEFQVRLGRTGACDAVLSVINTHMNSSTVLCRACGAVAFLSKSNDVNRDHLLELRACEKAVECLHKYPHHKGLLQVVCHVLLYLYYCMHDEKLAELKDNGALDSRGWVLDMSYEKMLSTWNPDTVVRDLVSKRNSNGFCSFIFCT